MRTYGSYLSRQQQIASSDGLVDTSEAGDISDPESQTRQNRKRNRKRKRRGDSVVVLDVAGGKGDLSWLLKNVDGLESVVMDPWKADPKSVSRNERMVRSIEYLRKNPDEARKRSVPFLPTFQPLAGLLPRLLEERNKRLLLRKKQAREHLGSHDEGSPSQTFEESLAEVNSGIHSNDEPCRPEDFLTPKILHVPLDEIMVQKVRNRIVSAESQTGNRSTETQTAADKHVDEDDEEVLDFLSSGRIKLVVGFHPDQATEPCIDLARVLGVPYCVVPCCVFPSEFPNRRLRVEHPENGHDDTDNHRKEPHFVPVRTYGQFLDYLRTKATTPMPETSDARIDSDACLGSQIQTAHLNFAFTETAKNIVLYTMPPSNPPVGSSA